MEKFFAATDAHFKKVTFEAREPQQQALEIGALIMRRLLRARICERLECPQTAMLLLHRLCFGHGQVEPFSAGLIVRVPAKQIGIEVGLSARSVYVPIQSLEAAGVVRLHAGRGNAPNMIEVLMPPPAADEPGDGPDPDPGASHCGRARAPTMTDAAQLARATARASLHSDTCEGRNPLTDNDLARATARASLHNDSTKVDNIGFCTENPHSSSGADSTVRTSTCTFTSTQESGEQKGGEGRFLGWLLSLKDMKPWTARKLASNPLITEEVALAARYELEHSTASKKPDFRPAGLIVHILKDPQSRIGKEAWDYAGHAVAGADNARRERQFLGTRVANLLAEPGTSPFNLGPVDGQSIEARATEIQQTLPKPELAVLHREAIDAAPAGLERLCVAKGDPRLLSQVHALIVRRLRGHPTPANAS